MRTAAIAFVMLLVSVACANRGMQAPDAAPTGGKGSPGVGGRGGTAADGGVDAKPDATGRAGSSAGGGAAGTAGVAGAGGRAGTAGGSAGAGGSGGPAGGAAGTSGSGGVAGGGGGSINVDAGCGPADGAAVSGPCNAMFSFEGGLPAGALLGDQTAFRTPMSSTAAYCGKSIALPTVFTSATDKGELVIPLATDGGSVDLTSKAISITYAADPGCGADVQLYLVVNTRGAPVMFSLPPVTGAWQTRSFNAAGGVSMAIGFSLQAFSLSNYAGTVYIDEIDVK
jgi:hypothetical protein